VPHDDKQAPGGSFHLQPCLSLNITYYRLCQVEAIAAIGDVCRPLGVGEAKLYMEEKHAYVWAKAKPTALGRLRTRMGGRLGD